jgi:hypothetical protein
VIPVNTGNGWLNFSAEIQYGQDSVGIMFLNGSNGGGHWNAIAIGFNTNPFSDNLILEYCVMGPGNGWQWWYFTLPYYPSQSYYTFVARNTPSGSPYITLRIAIHFQEGQPAELYVWTLNGSQWVPVYMQSYVPNATGDVGGWGTWILSTPWGWCGCYGEGGVNNSLTTVTFPAYVYTYSLHFRYTFQSQNDDGYTLQCVTKTFYLAPIDLVPGSNVIIVPDSSGTLVYNVTSTI